MLVCNISVRPRRTAIAATLAEIAAASDASTGQLVLAALVDEPTSVLDSVDAYLGEIMLEAASAGDTVDAGLGTEAAIDETATAADAPDATVGGAAVARSAMVATPMPVWVNTGTSREAYVDNAMINQ